MEARAWFVQVKSCTTNSIIPIITASSASFRSGIYRSLRCVCSIRLGIHRERRLELPVPSSHWSILLTRHYTFDALRLSIQQMNGTAALDRPSFFCCTLAAEAVASQQLWIEYCGNRRNVQRNVCPSCIIQRHAGLSL